MITTRFYANFYTTASFLTSLLFFRVKKHILSIYRNYKKFIFNCHIMAKYCNHIETYLFRKPLQFFNSAGKNQFNPYLQIYSL